MVLTDYLVAIDEEEEEETEGEKDEETKKKKVKYESIIEHLLHTSEYRKAPSAEVSLI